MTQRTANKREVLRDLGDGLVLRRAAVEDTEALVEFNALVHGLPGEPNEPFRVWTRDLMGGRLPSFRPDDFMLVERTDTSAIVSSLNLISQRWSYEGIEFPVGTIELVGTHIDYRHRGLVRAQMQAVHELSAQKGHLVQAINGIPWYYRQFGYELALELGGGRASYASNVPQLEEYETEPYLVRPVADADLPFLARVYGNGMRRYLVSCVRDDTMLRYELHGRSPDAADPVVMRVIERANAQPVGLLVHVPHLSRGNLRVLLYELGPEASWLMVTPSVLRYLKRTGEQYATRDNKAPFSALALALGTEHPVYHPFKERLPRADREHAWYVRVPNLPRFIRHIGPVLERRVERSFGAGYSGELTISFPKNWLRLSFRKGRLADVESWTPMDIDDRQARELRHAFFPGLTFLQLLLGFRSVEELEHAFPDCLIDSVEARQPLSVLFPKRASAIWAVQ